MFFKKLSQSEQLYIASKLLNKSKIDCVINGFEINEEMEEVARKYITEHMPLSKIFQEKHFWKYCFKSTLDTLDPRPETEIIIELLVKKYNKEQNLRFLEIGVGTGCLIISILKEFPNATAVGIDISEEALKVCEENRKNILNDNRLILIKNDWLSDINEKFNICVSNPPYLLLNEIDERQELKYDPFISLFGGKNPIEKYIEISDKKDLFEDIYLEIHPKFANKLLEYFPESKIYKDYSGFDRILNYNK